MGLDMFLDRAKTPKDLGGENPLTLAEILDREEIKTNTQEQKSAVLDALIREEMFLRGSHGYHWVSYFGEVGYWRKANHIHKWFVEHVQNGSDDCGTYLVTAEQMAELLELCKKVKSIAKLESGSLHNGTQYSHGKVTQIYEDGQVISNAEEVAAILPTQSGFFFGNTDYNEWYLYDIDNTIQVLEEALLPYNQKKYSYFYSSSW